MVTPMPVTLIGSATAVTSATVATSATAATSATKITTLSTPRTHKISTLVNVMLYVGEKSLLELTTL